MRSALAIVLALAGATASTTAYVRSNGPVRPASAWSLSERLGALRIDRALPPALSKPATFTVRGTHAVLKVREATGPVLLKCPLRGDLAGAYARYATSRAPGECETQAVDEVGDVLLYEVSGHVSPLCPGQYATLSEQQLHNALFLPAMEPPGEAAPVSVLKPGRLAQCAAGESNCALSKAAGALLYCGDLRTCAEGACFSGKEIQPDDVAVSLYYYQALAQAKTPSQVAPAACGPVPMSVHLSTLISEAITATSAQRFIEAQPWNASTIGVAAGSGETAGDLRAFFNKHPRGICLYVSGVDLSRPRDAEMAAQSLSFPVFAPFDPRVPGRATPVLKALQRAAFDDETMASIFARCDLPDPRGCAQKRDRIAAQLRASLGRLQPALTNLAADEIPYHLGGSGPFHLADYDFLHLTLESAAEVAKAKGSRSKLMIAYQPLWPESVAEKRAACLQQPGICLFRALWGTEGKAFSAAPDDDGFESLVALFARRDANTRCVRRLFNALAAAGEDRLLELQRELREPVGAGENRAPCDSRSRAAAGLVPRAGDGACPAPSDAKPFGESGSDDCRPVSLVYVQEEPWAGAAARLAAIAGSQRVAVSVSGIKASEVHRGALGSWDVLLTVASNYYNRNYPTLVPLLHPAGNHNLSGGQAVSEGPGRTLLAQYESSIVYPPPAWLATPSTTPLPRAESLKLLEDDVARGGPAPIFPLAFLKPDTLAIPEAQGEAAHSPWYLARLLQGWSEQQ